MSSLLKIDPSTQTKDSKHYNHLANQSKAANATAYRQWIESHPATTIHEANLARQRLRKLGVRALPLQDHRQVVHLRNRYTYFYQERTKSGDFRGLKMVEAVKLIAREWSALSASEKKVCRSRLQAGAGADVS